MSYIYILTNRSFINSIKIGYTDRSPHVRATELHTTGVPTPFRVYKYWEVKNGIETERDVHKLFSRYRHANNREFFTISPEEAEFIIEEFLIRYDDIVRIRRAKEAKESHLRKAYFEWRKIRESVNKECWDQVEQHFGLSYEQCYKNSSKFIDTPIIGLLGIFYTPKNDKNAEETLSLMRKKFHELYRIRKKNFFKSIGLECKIYPGGHGDDEFTFIDEYIIHEYPDGYYTHDSFTYLKIELTSEYNHKNFIRLQKDIQNNHENILHYGC